MSDYTRTNPVEDKPLRILAIDDDPDFHRLFGLYAETLGYMWESATNLEEALSAIQKAEENKNPFSVITIDMQFKMGAGEEPIGKAILQRIKSRNPYLACILITGSGGVDVLHLRDEYQLDAYIPKHRFDQDTLKENIKRALERVSRRRAISTGSAATSSSPVPTKKVKPKPRPTVFISYSHKDEKEKEELVSHLGVLENEGLVDVWVDDEIVPGGDWYDDINQTISRAKVAILLITANFLNSQFIKNEEVPRLLERRRHEGLVVFPVIARPCAWSRVNWLTKLNVKPKNGTPIWRQGGRYVDEELALIAETVADILDRASEA